MTEKSYYWSNVAIGDGVYSPYDDDEFSDIWRKLFIRNRNQQGVVEGYNNELQVTNPSGNTIRVATGAALVDGKFYETDANVDNTISTPAVSTRIDLIVLRKSWASQTIRVAVLTGVEGGAAPTPTRTDGVTWEITLASVRITTGGVITVTDQRDYIRSPLAPESTGNWVEIETVTGDGTSDTIDFSNIPATYKHLAIIGMGRGDGAVAESLVTVRFNGDTGANYNWQDMKGENAANSAASSTGDTGIDIGQVACASAGAGYAGGIEITIPNYMTTDFFKYLIAKTIHIPSAVAVDFSLRHVGGEWDDLTAIDQIELILTTGSAGNWDDGTTFTLYGME